MQAASASANSAPSQIAARRLVAFQSASVITKTTQNAAMMASPPPM